MEFTNVCVQTFALLVSIVFLVGHYQDYERNKSEWKIMCTMLWTNCAILICYVISCICEGNANLNILNIFVTWGTFSTGYILGICYTLYIKQCINIVNKLEIHMINVVIIIYVAATLISIIMSINGKYFEISNGSYKQGSLFVVNQIFAILGMLVNMIIILMHIKVIGFRKSLALIAYVVLPLVAIMIQNVYVELDTICLATTLSVIVIYLEIHVERKKREMYELAELKMNTMFSQMNPHFIYNTLAMIQDMCYGKVPEAEETVIQFSEFLRVNIDSVKEKKMIPFEQEINHTKNYLLLEQKRFGDMLEVEYDIQTMDFQIPPLTLQPIVENAVYHGIMKLEEGGKLCISVSENSKMYNIIVSDNGVGFEDEEIDKEINTKGIMNVSSRLDMMCGGKISVKSTKNKGTIVEITIPKRGENK